MKLRGKKLENFGEPLFVAEIGQNHDGSIEKAKKMITAAGELGCNYVKFQCWDKDSLFIKSFYKDKPGDPYLKTKSLEETLDMLSLSRENVEELVQYSREQKIGFVSTPVAEKYVDLLVSKDVDFLKIASFDLNNHQLLSYAASQGKPIVLSTGLATVQEIEDAIQVIYKASNRELMLLHCAAVYPPKDENVNLNNIDLLRDYFGLPVGFSDHTVGFSMALAAIAKGACLIEKHFTLDNTIASGDHPISADPEQMKVIVEQGRRIRTTLGSYRRDLSKDDLEYRAILRRSIVSRRAIRAGEVITADMIDYKRPGTGIQVCEAQYVLNRKARRDIPANVLINWDDLQ